MKKQMHEPYNLATLVFRLTKGAHKWVVEQAAQHPRGAHRLAHGGAAARPRAAFLPLSRFHVRHA